LLKDLLRFDADVVEEINEFLTDENNELINEILKVVEKYGTPEEINKLAEKARELPTIIQKLKDINSPYLKDLEWLIQQRDDNAFVSVSQYRKNILGEAFEGMVFDEEKAVTLEISALQYFPWLITQAKQAIEKQEIMPGRFIRVRNMKEQEADMGDILAVSAAMQIVGASYVETLSTNGTDGSNVHLNGPATITGYFGGIGQPNDHPLKWIDEYLYYYTNYGIQQVLNINPGTVFIAYILYRLGVDMKFKISVFMGNDNPFSVLWTLMMAKLFAREDGSTPLEGFNLANSVDNKTIELSSEIRAKLGLEDKVRIEHHITETYKSIVKQPYNRRDELLDLAKTVPNIAAKHEGSEPEIEMTLEHPSDILDYFRAKEEVVSSNSMELLEKNYLLKHHSINKTAQALTEKGFAFICAKNLHAK